LEEGRVFANNIILRTAVPPMALTAEVNRHVDQLTKDVRVAKITTMSEQVDASIVPERIISMFANGFGALGAFLAALGLYGLLAYTVARRTHEIGIRMALGASRDNVAGLVLRDSLATVLAGVAIGIPVAFWGTQFLASVVEGLPASNTLLIALGAAGMVAVALLASYIPTRRATRVDPLVALRYE